MITRRSFLRALGASAAVAAVPVSTEDAVSGWSLLNDGDGYQSWKHESGVIVWYIDRTIGGDGLWRWTADKGDGKHAVPATGKCADRDEAMRLAVKFEPIYEEMEARIASSRERHLPNGIARPYDVYMALLDAHLTSVRLIRASYGIPGEALV